MARVIGDTTCPGCNLTHEAAIDLDKIPQLKNAQFSQDIRVAKEPEKQPDFDAIIEKKLKEKEPKKEEPPKVKVVAPSYQPKHLCKGAGCEGHDNENYTMRVKKKCSNCDQFAPDSVKKCPWCGETDFDDIDDDELDELNIPRPREHSHTHDD